MSPANGRSCQQARETLHALLDAELPDARLERRLETHLAGCPACREFAAEMRAVQSGLRGLPELKLPDVALEGVWKRTLRARPERVWRRPRNVAAAAALIAVMLLGGLWLRRGVGPREPSEEELRRAAAEVRLVLGVTSEALRRTGRAAFGEVLTEEVSGALRRVPIEWPAPNDAQRREL